MTTITTTPIHTVRIVDDEGREYLFASPDGELYLEVRSLTGITAESLLHTMKHGTFNQETKTGILPYADAPPVLPADQGLALGQVDHLRGPDMTQATEVVTEAMIERGARALWDARNPYTPLSSLDEYEREGAWANACSDVEAVLNAALTEGG